MCTGKLTKSLEPRILWAEPSFLINYTDLTMYNVAITEIDFMLIQKERSALVPTESGLTTYLIELKDVKGGSVGKIKDSAIFSQYLRIAAIQPRNQVRIVLDINVRDGAGAGIPAELYGAVHLPISRWVIGEGLTEKVLERLSLETGLKMRSCKPGVGDPTVYDLLTYVAEIEEVFSEINNLLNTALLYGSPQAIRYLGLPESPGAPKDDEGPLAYIYHRGYDKQASNWVDKAWREVAKEKIRSLVLYLYGGDKKTVDSAVKAGGVKHAVGEFMRLFSKLPASRTEEYRESNCSHTIPELSDNRLSRVSLRIFVPYLRGIRSAIALSLLWVMIASTVGRDKDVTIDVELSHTGSAGGAKGSLDDAEELKKYIDALSYCSNAPPSQYIEKLKIGSLRLVPNDYSSLRSGKIDEVADKILKPNEDCCEGCANVLLLLPEVPKDLLKSLAIKLWRKGLSGSSDRCGLRVYLFAPKYPVYHEEYRQLFKVSKDSRLLDVEHRNKIVVLNGRELRMWSNTNCCPIYPAGISGGAGQCTNLPRAGGSQYLVIDKPQYCVTSLNDLLPVR